jgi:hypothetical protein
MLMVIQSRWNGNCLDDEKPVQGGVSLCQQDSDGLEDIFHPVCRKAILAILTSSFAFSPTGIVEVGEAVLTSWPFVPYTAWPVALNFIASGE